MEQRDRERLGVIENPEFGVDDRGMVSLRFTVAMDESSKFDVLMAHPDLYTKAISSAGVSDVSRLNGKTCWYTRDGMRGEFVRMYGAKR